MEVEKGANFYGDGGIGYILMRNPHTRFTGWRMCRRRIVEPSRSLLVDRAGTDGDNVMQSLSSSSFSSLASCLRF